MVHKRKRNDSDSDSDYCDDKKQRILDKEEELISKLLDEILSDSIKDEESKLKLEYNKLLDIIYNREINEKQILKSTLSKEEKIWMIEHLNILRNTSVDTEDYYELKTMLYNKIKDIEDLNTEEVIVYNKLKTKINKTDSIKKKILYSEHCDDIKVKLFNKYMKLLKTRNDSDHFKEETWINNVLSLPTKCKTICESIKEKSIGYKLKNVKNLLDKNLYGQQKAKEQILQAIVPILSGNYNNRKCITFQGKPGVGKTEFVKSLSKILELPFNQISLGGITDPAIFNGHDYTYIGSKYGLIVNSLINMKYKNGILFLDEFDKLGKGHRATDVFSVFLHILDYTQNMHFKDNYMPEIPIDLSNLLIFVSVNDIDLVDKIVRDRLNPVIDFKDYTLDDKIKIAVNFFVPKAKKNMNFKKKDIVIKKKIMKYIITTGKSKNKAGVRQLDGDIRDIFEKLSLLRYSKDINVSYKIKDFKLPFTLTKENVDTLLSDNKLIKNKTMYS